MTYSDNIHAEIQRLRRIGYSDEHISQIITLYSGYTSWQALSTNQQRRLAGDLSRYTHIARKWHYSLTGYLH